MSRLKQAIRSCPALYRAALLARKGILGGYMRLCRSILGVDRHRAVFSSFRSTAYSDGPRAVSEALHRLMPQLEIVWLVPEGAGDTPEYVKRIPPHTAAALRLLATSGVLVDNFNLPFYRSVGKNQYLVQLWHGDRPFKKIQFDANPGEGYIDGDVTSLFAVGSAFGRDLARRAFRYGGEILMDGTPRCDMLVAQPDGVRDAVRRALSAPEGARIALYAPTFRDENAGGRQESGLDLARCAACLQEAWGGQWIVWSRKHDLVGRLLVASARDVSAWPEMAELLLASDALITDYSSCAADFALTGKPVYLYQADRAEYTRRDRELYFDVDHSPFRAATSAVAFYKLLRTPFDPAENGRAIGAFFGTCETGRAAEAVARRIQMEIDGGRQS